MLYTNERPHRETYYRVPCVALNGNLAGSYEKVGSDALLVVNR